MQDSGDAASNKDNSKESLWSKMSLGDNKTDEKFAKLMGIKQTDQVCAERCSYEGKATRKQKPQRLWLDFDVMCWCRVV